MQLFLDYLGFLLVRLFGDILGVNDPLLHLNIMIFCIVSSLKFALHEKKTTLWDKTGCNPSTHISWAKTSFILGWE